MDSKGNILIVEDELYLSQAIASKLQEAGFNTTTADNGQTGLANALEIQPDVILLDINIPIMDGLTVLKKLREDPRGKHIAVVILTNEDDDQKVLEGLQGQAAAYFIKSQTSLDSILNTVQSLIKPATTS